MVMETLPSVQNLKQELVHFAWNQRWIDIYDVYAPSDFALQIGL